MNVLLRITASASDIQVDLSKPTIAVGDGDPCCLKCVQLHEATAAHMNLASEYLPRELAAYESDAEDSAPPSEDCHDAHQEAECFPAVAGPGPAEDIAEGFEGFHGFEDVADELDAPHDHMAHAGSTAELPPRENTGARVEYHRTRKGWQGWYDRCPRTGLPAGMGDGHCKCPGSSAHHSIYHAGDEADGAAEQAVLDWIWSQHAVHSC